MMKHLILFLLLIGSLPDSWAADLCAPPLTEVQLLTIGKEKGDVLCLLSGPHDLPHVRMIHIIKTDPACAPDIAVRDGNNKVFEYRHLAGSVILDFLIADNSAGITIGDCRVLP